MSLPQILVPLDTSESAEAGLPIARALAASTNAVLNLVVVSTDIEPDERAGRTPIWRTSLRWNACLASRYG